MTVRNYNGKKPKIHPTAFIHPSAEVIGDVTIGANTSVWCNASIRGDAWPIKIGKNVSIQDNSVLHSTEGKHQTIIDNNVVIGHRTVVHACRIRKHAMVAIGAIVLDGADVGEYAIVAAGAVVPPGTKIPKETVVMGVPAKPVKKTSKTLKKYIDNDVKLYAKYTKLHRTTSTKSILNTIA